MPGKILHLRAYRHSARRRIRRQSRDRFRLKPIFADDEHKPPAKCQWLLDCHNHDDPLSWECCNCGGGWEYGDAWFWHPRTDQRVCPHCEDHFVHEDAIRNPRIRK